MITRPPASSLRNKSGGSGGSTLRKHRPDYMLIVLASLLLIIGIVVVTAISPGLAAGRGVPQNYYVTKQITAAILGVVTFFMASRISFGFMRKMIKPMAIFSAILTVVALVTPATKEYPAHRWVRAGGFSFQPVEFTKLVFIIGVAAFLVTQLKKGLLRNDKKTLYPIVSIVGAVLIFVTFFQSDLGSAGVIAAIVGAMLFVIAVPLRKLFLIGLVGVLGLTIAISSVGYRRDRFLTYLNPERDCQVVGYQSCQALIAVGSGGITGKGLGHSVQAYGYLPEAANDSIFAIMAEKFGFFGCSLIIILYGAFLLRIFRVVERVEDDYIQLVCIGVMTWLSFQAIVNIGAMLGLLPLKGITLPFISYGGTSVVFAMAAIGLVFQASKYTSYRLQPKLSKVVTRVK